MKSRLIVDKALPRKVYENVMSDARKRCADDIMHQLGINMDAMILYTYMCMHPNCSKTELHDLHRRFILNTKFLGKKFCLEEDPSYVAKEILKEYKIDYDEWNYKDLQQWEKIKDGIDYNMSLEEFTKVCDSYVKKTKRPNAQIGSEFEEELCKLLNKDGFWVTRLNRNSSGQPADIIATRDGKALLIDAKVCTNNKFKTSRIEPNQITAMTLWEMRGNQCGWFALKTDDGIYLIASNVLFDIKKMELTLEDIKSYGIEYEKWRKNGYCSK